MKRPTTVDLTRPYAGWQAAPMPYANAPLRLVRLDSAPGTFAIYAHFPAGFQRTDVGGYDATEDFLVLDGELVVGDCVLVRGDLTHVPAGAVRRETRSKRGCTTLAWFSGRAEFRLTSQLATTPVGEPTTVSVLEAAPGIVLERPSGTWRTTLDPGSVGAADDVLDLALRRWTRGLPVDATDGPMLVRTTA